MTTLTVLAQAQYYMGGDRMNGGWGWGMAALMVVALVAIVALVVWLVRSAGVHPHGAAVPADTPMQVLGRRFAAGEITSDEYHERATILDKK
jgi:uncharacterized membrane protein